MTNWPLRMFKMWISRRKKTVFSAFLLGGIIYMIVQVTYYQQAYSPLRVLPNAESEARRLLKFITMYHYQCNSSISGGNGTSWKMCTDADVGINLDSNVPKIAYSVGPQWEYGFEQVLAKNLSFQTYIFVHYSIPPALRTMNASHVYKTVIVPNDPADFGRNSFETQTLNNVIEKLNHQHIDLLKLESLLDLSNTHELLFYLIKDGLLSNVKQLHVVFDIDKIDEDSLYKWYRTLYLLFHEAGFRLYHTSASDTLCLQVTMMESCRYYMSWVQNPGPKTFILYPPAIDGSYELEVKRMLEFLEEQNPVCNNNIDVPVSKSNTFSLCGDILFQKRVVDSDCNILVFRDKPSVMSTIDIKGGKCSIQTFALVSKGGTVKVFSNQDTTPTDEDFVTIVERHIKPKSINIIYISSVAWEVITPLLDSGSLQDIDQLTVNVEVLDSRPEENPLLIRQRYSELKRIQSSGFKFYEIKPFVNGALLFKHHAQEDCCFRLGFIKS
ncbi:uncharacterized protein LOC121372358 [Gigantopelta aegis]|uniref:uncharacterized protein LOC121372358 n=1 Tax=Gigantopelta aegis TaxID=1735272 RepID=UPI001B88968E|nr:uncharacterized protein LOC121372358 [Gigantopelta aegis]